ncbi:MAG: hypothetical protein KDM91_20815 [Verrucomicrobiae bacterium]|nr:hypothetical protein [Verrucomicrobiae bacterium]
MENVFEYRSRRGEEAFQRAMNLGRAVTRWLSGLDEKATKQMDFANLDYRSRNKVAEQFFGDNDAYLPGLYVNLNPGSSWRMGKEGRAIAEKWAPVRRQVHDDLCRAMMRLPALARHTFAYHAAVAMAEDRDKALDDPELERLARAALEADAKMPRGTTPQFSTHSHSFERPVTTLWAPEEFLIRRALKAGDFAAADAVLETLKTAKRRDLSASAEAYRTLAFGPAGEFERAARAYLAATANSAGGYHGNNQPYATEGALSLSSKLFEIWEIRGEALKEFDFGKFALESAKKSQGAEAVLAVSLIEKTAREHGFEAARPLLDKLTVACLGEREKWDAFKKEAQRRVPTSGGGYYYQGGEFTRPEHALYAALMQRLLWQPGTVMPVAAYLKDNSLDTNEQVTSNSLLSYLASSRLGEEPELALAIFEGSPFLSPVESFRALTLGKDKRIVLRDCLDQIKKGGPARQKLREAAAAKGTFGGDLVAASLADSPAAALTEALGKHRAAIESKLSDEATAELAAFVKASLPGGFDPGPVSADARAVLDRLGAERAKTAREKAEEFLALKNLDEIDASRSYELRRRLGALLPTLWTAREWDLGVKAYWHAMDLARKKMKSNQWGDNVSSGWNLEGDVLYDAMNNASGSDLERIALFEKIVQSDTEGRLPITAGGMGFAGDIRDAFNRAGGETNLEKSADTVAARLHELCGDAASVTVSMYFMEFAFQLRPPLLPRLVAWADSRSSGQPWSPLAAEIAQSLRMGLQTGTKPDYKPLWAKVPDLETWQPHYVAMLKDDSRTLPWRLAVADEVCDADADIAPETATACAELLAEALAADAPMNAWHVHRVAMQFNKLEKTADWDATARRLAEGWAFKNRNNQKPGSSGLAFDPFDEPVLSMLETHLRLGDAELTRKMRTEKNAFDRTKSTCRAVAALVAWGDDEGANAVLREGKEFQDITDDYETGAGVYRVYYTRRLHERLPEFLETVEDPGLRYFADLILRGAPDPPPDRKEAGADHPARGPRLAEAARRFTDIDFGKSKFGGLLRERCLQQIAAIDGPAGIVAPIWEKEYSAAKCRVLCDLDNYKKIEHGARPLAAHAAIRLRQGDTAVVDDFIAAVNGSGNDTYYRREAMEHFCGRLIESLKFRGPQATPEEWTGYAVALGRLLSEVKGRPLEHDNLAQTTAAYLTASAVAGREKEVVAWAKALDPKSAETCATTLRRKTAPFWAAIAQILKVKAPDEKLRPAPEKREAALRLVLSCPQMEKAFGSHETLYKPLLDQALVTREELLGGPGERLTAVFPRGGWAAAEIARFLADDGRWDEAIALSERSTTVSDPKTSEVRYARLAIRHAELLLEAKRPAEAGQSLEKTGANFSQDKLPDDVRQTLARVRQALKASAKK